MTPLDKIIRAEIKQTGPISVARYMELCLSHPEHGYYTTRDPLGAEGDFTTAPEISQMFGEMIGLWLAQVWIDQGKPDLVRLVELGPGRGTLMADVLRVATSVPGFRQALDIWMVETSPALRAAQEKTLDRHEISWAKDIGDVPAGCTFILANEFFDALPIDQFQKVDEVWLKRVVQAREGTLQFGLNNIGGTRPEMSALSFPDGAIVEVNTAAQSIAAELGDRISAHGGATLIIDYGELEGSGDTLQAVRNHTTQSPLLCPGEADLTAHVDFGALQRPFKDLQSQFTTQGKFLSSIGIGARAQALATGKPDADARDIAKALHRLTNDAEMGQLFKVMSITPCSSPIPPGFPNDTSPN